MKKFKSSTPKVKDIWKRFKYALKNPDKWYSWRIFWLDVHQIIFDIEAKII